MLFGLFMTFFKIGLFTIGGGYAMLPIVQREVVNGKGWMTDDEFLDAISLTNSLPGPLITNAATFIGYKIKGVKGAIASVLGAIVPSIMVILIIATVFTKAIENPYVSYFFEGVRPAVFSLILFSLYKLGKSAKLGEMFNLIIAACAFVMVAFLKLSPIIVVICAAAVALATSYAAEKKAKETSQEKEATHESDD